jgi:maltose alpha-D-glucosyltransferase/alpha-amylase
MSQWLDNAVFYEIYPQSFYDANGDGIGDLEGIIQKLDYVKELGCNAIWLNPCFDSPFGDAGYDIRDYRKVAPRYGSNEDLKRLFAEARKKRLRVILDLVPGHTSEEHPWFLESSKAEPNQYWNRYIWTDEFNANPRGFGYIGGVAEHPGAYITNFYKCQPALNYGFYTCQEPWQLPLDHPDCIATFDALKGIMRYWLDAGADGFRVDMAYSIVKNDTPERTGASRLWRDIRRMLDLEYPEAALISEWAFPSQAIPAGFHADFFIHFLGLKGYLSLTRDYPVDNQNRITGVDRSFFKKDGGGDITRFLDEYIEHYEKTKNWGFISLVTGNHDLIRLSYNLTQREMAIAFGMIFTMPGVPFLYYGDEIGMRYLSLPTKEGGYYRTGSRTPMQWDTGKNRGFSSTESGKLYLPVDPSPDAPTVETAKNDPASLLNITKKLLCLRNSEGDLQSNPNLEIIYAERGKLPFIYRRGNFIIAVNPGGKKVEKNISRLGLNNTEVVFSIGKCFVKNNVCIMEEQSFGIWRVSIA